MSLEDQLLEGDLELIIASCMRRIDRGEVINQQQLLLDHPHLKADLEAYFADVVLIEQLAGPTASDLLSPTDSAPGGKRATSVEPGATLIVDHPAGQSEQGSGRLGGDFGRYQIESVLGEGAMGSVYLAHDTELHRQVALKVPKLDESDSETELLERFYREARAAATLRHRGICPVYDVGTQDGINYIAMAYISGMPLSRFLAHGKIKSQRNMAVIIRKLALALDAAHQKGVIHRDLKPANVMVDEDNEPVIMDFGLARQLNQQDASRLTMAGTIIGSPAYMSPEQVSGDIDLVGTQSDIYSLGVMLYELLTGTVPFRGPVVVIIGQIIGTEPDRPSNIRDGVDQELEAICLKMMAKNKADRYQSMQEVAEALTAYLKKPAKKSADKSRSRQTQAADSPQLEKPPLPAPPTRISARQRKPRRKQTEKRPTTLLEHIKKSTMRARIIAAAVSGVPLFVFAVITLLFQVEGRSVAVTIDDPSANVLFDGNQYVEFDGTKVGHVELDVGPHTVTVTRNGTIVKGWEQISYVVKEEGKNLLEIEVLDSPKSPANIEAEPQERTQVLATREPVPSSKQPNPKKAIARSTSIAAPPEGTWMPGPAKNVIPGFIARPASILGLKRWQIINKVSGAIQYCVVFSPDQQEFACASSDGLIRIYDTQSLKLIRVLRGHNYTVQSIAYRPDGKQMVSASMDGTVRFWSMDGTPGKVLTGPPFHSVTYRPDGKQIAAAAGIDNQVYLWSTDGTPGLALKGHTGPVFSVAYRPDGKQIASASQDKTVRLWNADGSAGPVFKGHTGSVNCVAWRPDGKQLASTGDKTVRLWNTEGKTENVLKLSTGAGYAVAYRPDGQQIAAAGVNMMIQTWDREGKPGPSFLGHKHQIQSVAYSPDGKQIASGGHDSTLRLFNLEGSPHRLIKKMTSAIEAVAYRPDGQQLATGGEDGTVRLWSSQGTPGHVLLGKFSRWKEHDSPVYAVAYRPDGRQLASGGWDNTVRLWNTDGTPDRVFNGIDSAIYALAWRPDGQQLAIGCRDSTVQLWSAEGKPGEVLKGHFDEVRDIAYHPAGTQLASASSDRTVRLWNTDGTAGPVLNDHNGNVWEVDYHPDGRSLTTGSSDQTARFWSLEGTLENEIDTTRIVNSLDFHPDGQKLVAGGGGQRGDDFPFQIWSVSGTKELDFRGHTRKINAIKYRSDGLQIATVSDDHTLRLWDARTGETQLTIVPVSDQRAAVFTAAGELLHGKPAVFDEALVYITEFVDGSQEILTPSEFYEKYRNTTKSSRPNQQEAQ